MKRSALTSCLGGLSFACVALAQDKAPPDPVSVEQAIADAKAGLDRAEARPERPLPREALAQVNELIVSIETQDPGNAWLPYLYGRAYFLMGRTTDAADKLRPFIETREGRNEWRAFRMLGDLFVAEFPNLAESYYKKALDLNATEASLYHGLSVCAFRRGAGPEAIRLARQAVQTGGELNVAHLSHLARVLAANQQWAEADRTAVAAVERSKVIAEQRPGVRAALQNVASQYEHLVSLLQDKLNAVGAAGEDYLRLAQYVEERAELARRVARFDTLSILETGVQATAPNTSIPLLERFAVTLAEVGRKQAAIDAFEKLLARDPDNAAAKQWLIQLNAPAQTASTP